MSELDGVLEGLLGWSAAAVALFLIVRAPIVGVCLLIFLSPLKTLPGTYGTITVAKVVGAVTLAVVLLRLIIDRGRVRLTHCELPLVMVVLVLVLAIGGSPNPERDANFLLSYLTLFFLVFLIVNAARTPRELHWVGCAFLGSILLPVISALMQGMVGEDMFGVTPYRGTSRVRGTFSGPNGLGLLLACGGTYCFAFLSMAWDRLRLSRKLLGTLFFLSMLWAAFYTQSRTELLCLLAGLLYVFLRLPTERLFNPLGWRPKRARLALCVLTLAAGGGYIVYQSALWQERLTKLTGILEEGGTSTETRLNDVEFAWKSALSNPEFALLGPGLGAHRALAAQVRGERMALSGVPHNIVLHFFVMGGVIGLLALALVVRALWIHASFSIVLASQAPDVIGWHWFAAWATLVASIPALILQGAAMSNEIWLLTAIAFLGKNLATEHARQALAG
ncbi:MAG: O-antigen ligase family protein [Planctomycetes bacterium]|nr:O-antigen ligase family protein [Planctomycetota bacterium]